MPVLLPAPRRPLSRLLLVTAFLVVAAACGSQAPKLPVAGSVDADKFLFDRGSEAMAKHKWLEAREYFKRLVDTYPQSTYRTEAKLGVGDSYLGENRVDSDILAANEFREFLTFFPLNERADYAQYRLAIAQMRQMLGPQRDQTATKDALKELDTFLRNYPTSSLRDEVVKLRRETRDRLSDSEYLVGLHYYRVKWWPGAIDRLKGLLTDDPDYTRKDEVYFYLAESTYRAGRPLEALPYYAKLVEEFPQSQHAPDARKRIAEIKP